MSGLLNDISQDLQKHCKNIDDFNKDVLKTLENGNKEFTENLLKILQDASRPFGNLLNPPKPGPFNPFAD